MATQDAFGKAGHAQLAVNAAGSRSDLFSSRLDWNTDWTAASKVTADGWQTEIAIPSGALRDGLDADSGWIFNIARTGCDPDLT